MQRLKKRPAIAIGAIAAAALVGVAGRLESPAQAQQAFDAVGRIFSVIK